MTPTTNNAPRLTRNTVTAIDHIITNTVISAIQLTSGIIKTNISDNFLIVFTLNKWEKCKPRKCKIRHSLFINTSTEKNK